MIDNNKLIEIINSSHTFPEKVMLLRDIGIERYIVDMVKMEQISYSLSDYNIQKLSVGNINSPLAVEFDERMLIDAIRASQRGEINYHAFIDRILAAGVAHYVVYINGKCVCYYGRNGESYVERFPF